MNIVNIKEEKVSLEDIKYPCLMKSVVSGSIMLFTKHGEGIVIKSSHNEEGEFDKDWCMDSFKLFKGSVTIEND